MIRAALALLSFVACQRLDSRAPAPVPAAEPIQKPTRISIANFNEGQLTDCMDLSFTVVMADGGRVDRDAFAARFIEGMDLKDSAVRLKSSCGEQFADRPLFASCDAPIKVAAGTVAMLSLYFDFDVVVGSDDDMKACLKMGGSWSSMPRNSAAFRHAKLEHDLRDSQKLMKRALRTP